MFPNRAQRFAEDGNLCSFGISEAVLGVSLGGLLGSGLGIGATAGGILAGVGEGAGLGALTSAIEGKPLGKGALFGGLTGGAVAGLGPVLGSGLESAGVSAGTATTLGDVGAGIAGGTLGSVATGQSPLTGAIEGGGAGLLSGLTSGAGSAPTSGPSGSAGTAAVSTAANAPAGAGGAAAPGAVSLPASGGGATPVDPTQALGFGSQTDVTSFQTPLPAGSPALNTDLTPSAGIGTAVGAGPYGGTGGGVNNLLGFLGNNPGLLIGAGALGLDAIMGNKPLPAQTQVQNQAAGEASMGRTLSSYEQSGTLPAGMQEIVDANTNAGIAKVKSTYASLGLSGSSMEAEAVAQVHQASSAQVAQMANQLLQQGATWSGMSNQEFNTLLQTQMS